MLTDLNPSDKNSIATVGNEAIQSSAPPYEPLVSTKNEDNNQASISSDATGILQNESLYGNIPAKETFTSAPIISTPQDTLANNSTLGDIQYKPIAQATAAYAGSPTPTQTHGYTATDGVAAHGTVDPNSLVQNQFNKVLNSNTNANGVPDWAQPAVTAANQRSNALGLGASTMAANAETGAILTTALPIAEQNAHTYQLMNTQNVTNDQYTMLSNTAARNAAEQFNAKSQNQTDQFFSNLAANAILQNASAATAVSKYNAGQTNTVEDFRSNLDNTRDEFNSANQLIVDQSNVKWQRSINTSNTAADNAANQANVKNAFNVQQGALNDLWQQARDEASWAVTSSENSQSRGLSLVNSSLNRQTSYGILNSQLSSTMYSQLGQFGVSLLGGTSGIAKGVKDLVGSSGTSGYGKYGSVSGSGSVNDFGGGTDTTSASHGGIITNHNQDFNSNSKGAGVDLTSDTAHISTDANNQTKINFGKYK